MLSLRVGDKITFERFVVEGLLTGTLPTKVGGGDRDHNVLPRTMNFEFLRPVSRGIPSFVK
jgi:hypothetical protein